MNTTIDRETVFSPCRKYRYTLWREWSDLLNPNLTFVQFIGLNPSTADETADDPTIRRCIQFAKDWGFGAFCMTNLFAYRATDPREMMKAHDPLGPDNLDWIIRTAISSDLIVFAWGANGTFHQQGHFVHQHLRFNTCCGRKIRQLGLCANLEPKHPLYLKKTTLPMEFT